MPEERAKSKDQSLDGDQIGGFVQGDLEVFYDVLVRRNDGYRLEGRHACLFRGLATMLDGFLPLSLESSRDQDHIDD